MDQPEFCPPTASNYVCTAHINACVDNAKLAYFLHGRYAPKIFPCCTVTGLFPRVTYQVFEQEHAKIVISGATSPEEALYGLHVLVHLLSRGFKTAIKISNFRVENIVAFGGFGFWFDQLKFFQHYQMSGEPPKSMANAGLALDRSSSRSTTTPTSNKKRNKMRGACFAEFKPTRFKGLQFFIKYPIVVILYPTGKYVVTGSNNKEDILLALNAVDWSKYGLAPGDTIEKMRQRINKMSAISKWLPYGHHAFNDARKPFCNFISRAYYVATNQKSKRFTVRKTAHPQYSLAGASQQQQRQQRASGEPQSHEQQRGPGQKRPPSSTSSWQASAAENWSV